MNAMANESSGLIDMKALMEAARAHGAPVRANVRHSLELAFARPVPLGAAAYPVLVPPMLSTPRRRSERAHTVLVAGLAALAVALLAVAGTLVATWPRAPIARPMRTTRAARPVPPPTIAAPVVPAIVTVPAPVDPPATAPAAPVARPRGVHRRHVTPRHDPPALPVATPAPVPQRDPSRPRTLEELMAEALR